VEFRRRRFLQLAAGAAALPLVPQRAFAEAYPARPLRMIVPFAAGSAPDIIARLAGQWLSDGVGQPVIIDNRPGAASNIGTEVAVHAAPDGYTLQMTVLTNVFNAELYKNLSCNFVTDVTHVGGVANAPYVVIVAPSFPAKTIPEFIAYAKANPGKINFASGGKGSSSHIFGELFKIMTGIDMVHVPYRGVYMTDLMSGVVHVVVNPIPQALELIRTGQLRALDHAVEAHVAFARLAAEQLVLVETDAVVDHQDTDAALREKAQANANERCLRMPHHVVQRLLDQPQGHRRRFAEGRRLRPARGDGEGQPRGLGNPLDGRLRRRDQPQQVQLRRSQRKRQRLQLLHRRQRHVHCRIRVLLRRLRFTRGLGGMQVDHHPGQRLAQLVVQLAGDQGAFPFLRDDQPRRQFLQPPVRGFELAAEALLLERTLALGHHPFDDLRQRSELVLGDVILGAAAKHVDGRFFADRARDDDQRSRDLARDQDLQRRIRRKARHVEVAQDGVPVARQGIDEGGCVIHAVELVAPIRVGAFERDLHQFDVVGVVLDAQQPDRREPVPRGGGFGARVGAVQDGRDHGCADDGPRPVRGVREFS